MAVHRLALAITLVLLGSGLASGQGSATSSISGVVVDSGGGIIPGANVVVKNNATNTVLDVVTNSTGAFSVPALNPGVYTVTISLTGFKTSIVKDIRLLAAVPFDLKAVLEVGRFEETVTVVSQSELIQTRSATVSSTVNVDAINSLPLPTRNALNFVAFLSGVNTTGINRDSNFNGLPSSATAISLDGVNNNENYNKSTEGLFAMVTPRQDAVEAVTVTMATPGSDSGGHGAVSINFVTRSGTDRFTGSAYEYMRRPGLNTNYYFNEIRGLAKNQVKIDQYGIRQGGPIVIPGLYNGRGRAFFFGNYEEFRMPNSFSRTRVILTPAAQAGNFSYGGRQVNLFTLAAGLGQTPDPDPTVASVLNAIRAATGTTGTVTQSSDPNTMSYDFLSGGDQIEKQLTTRVDYNLGSRHRLTGTYTHQTIDRNPDHLNSVDVRFPGALNARRYLSYRNIASGALRTVLGGTVVNELRGGIKWGPSFFGKPEWIGPDTFTDEGGRALVFGNVGQTLTNMYASFSPSARSAWSWNIDETLNWQKGNHSLKFGASFYDGHMWNLSQTMVPQINFGVDSSDPANGMFTAGNFPGASSSQLGYAKQLYALLTGRVTGITANARLDENTGQYVLLGPNTMRLRQMEFGAFAQDVWRLNPQLTINAGLRWDLQLPIAPENDVMSTSYFADLCGVSGVGSQYGCNLYQPGTLSGVKPSYVKYDKGSPGYKTDWNNVAPSIGLAWRPLVETGILRAILGDPEQATFRAGYSQAFTREGMALYYGVYSGNQGSTIDASRSAALSGSNALVGPGQSWPVLLRDESRLAAPPIATSPVYPIQATVANSISIFDPQIQVANARSVTLSLQRAITKDMAFEVRYNGTWGRDVWSQYDYNYGNINIVENKFLQEFRTAQANLQANIAGGKGNTAAYTGIAGTLPLPIMLAYFQGLPASLASDPTKYTSTQFSNSTVLTTLATYNPQPCCSTSSSTPSLAYYLFNDATRRANALAAGLGANFFVVNPDVSNDYIYKSDGFTNYNALQLELRQRMAHGLQFMINYQFATANSSRSLGQRYALVSQASTAVPRHAIKTTWDYSVPIGRGRAIGADMSRWVDALVGGWEFHGAGRVQNRWLDFGNVRVVGMTVDELRGAYGIRIANDAVTGVKTVYTLPQDIIDNTIKAFSTSATSATGYGSLGPPQGRYLAPANGPDCIQVRAGECAALNNQVLSPMFVRFDVSLAKKFRFTSRLNFELRLDVMNVFNNINFNSVAQTGSSATINQVTSGYTDMSNTFDPGGRLGQIVFRLNW